MVLSKRSLIHPAARALRGRRVRQLPAKNLIIPEAPLKLIRLKDETIT